MFCPKCGAQAIVGQKFCKTCGINLELMSNALEGGEDTLGQLRLDMEALKTSAKNFGKGVPLAVSNWHNNTVGKLHSKDEPRLPKPKEWPDGLVWRRGTRLRSLLPGPDCHQRWCDSQHRGSIQKAYARA